MKQRKKVLSTLLVLVMALSIMWAFAITVSAASYTGTVATGNSAPLNVRASASTSSALLGTINNGTVLAVTDYNTDWYQITFNGQTAYVMKQYITVGGSGGGSGGTYTLVKPLAHGSTGANSTTDSGLDIFAAVGTDVYAAASGYIVYSEYGHTFCAPPTYPNDTPNSILIKLDDPITYNGRTAYYMWYTHLSSIVFNVKDGSALTTHVTAGQKIGASGIGANSAHLHFGIIINKAQSNSNDWFSPTEVRTLLGLTTNQNF